MGCNFKLNSLKMENVFACGGPAKTICSSSSVKKYTFLVSMSDNQPFWPESGKINNLFCMYITNIR